MNNQRGFSLGELSVALAVSSAAMLALSTLAIFASQNYLEIRYRLEAQAESIRAEQLLRNFMGQAILIQDPTVNPLGNAGKVIPGANVGEIAADFDFSSFADWGAVIYKPVAVFNREWQNVSMVGAGANMVSDMYATGIFVRRPEQTTSGVLFFDSGLAGGGGKSDIVQASYDDVWVGNIVEFGFSSQRVPGVNGPPPALPQAIASVTFRYVIRYHTKSGLQRTWCPAADVGGPGCLNTGGFKDLPRTVRIVLRNNDINATNQDPAFAAWQFNRPLGFLHFFRPVTPNVWEN